MRILELEIHNIRGIKNLTLEPNGANYVIWGPNGSGKSAVVDAVDFLLTGKISRLMGEGTSGLSLKAHGPHIDHKPREASVSAKIRVAGHDEPIILSRTMSAPNTLVYPPECKNLVDPILEVASKGQHVLSRREILKYVAAEAGKRSAEVQALLNLTDLEEIRKACGRALNTARAELANAETAYGSAQATVRTTLGLDVFEAEGAQQAINKLRQTLGGQPLSAFNSGILKDGLNTPTLDPKSQGVNPLLLERLHTSVSTILDNLGVSVASPDRDLRASLVELRNNRDALNGITKLKLMELGIEQIPDDGTCPLCGKQWEPGQLREHLRSHILNARAASEEATKIRTLASRLIISANNLNSGLSQFAVAATKLGLTTDEVRLKEWQGEIVGLLDRLEDPIAKYPSGRDDSSLVAKLFAPDGASDILKKISSEAAKSTPPVSAEQLAWDTLTSLRENWKHYESASERVTASRSFYKYAEALDSSFGDARESILASLFTSIETRFSTLYKLIHEEDEPSFESSLRPDGASLVFEVDFYGRGKFPPLALHSEGHQDTMGLCLYLALAERLTRNVIELTILDDVVMSVDSGHRRKVCELLASQFHSRQFLITTHDHTWARQLTTTGVVPRKNAIEFTRWSLETGPFVATEMDEAGFWKKIAEEVESNDIPAAALRLRRGAEQFFEQTCDTLRAIVRYRSDGRWDLSDFASGAIGAYKKYLKEAKASANSWGDHGRVLELEEIESIASQIIQRSQIEQWGINENVHFNRWGDFQPGDFRPVAEAWRDLLGLFQCTRCGGIIFVSVENQTPTSVRCHCSNVDWNLIRRGQT